LKVLRARAALAELYTLGEWTTGLMNIHAEDLIIKIAVRKEDVKEALINSLSQMGFRNIIPIEDGLPLPKQHHVEQCDLLIADLDPGDSIRTDAVLMMKKNSYPKHLPVLLLTNGTEKDKYWGLLTKGLVDDCIAYPFTAAALKKKIFKCALESFAERLRVLVVDDASAMRDSVKFSLQQMGFKHIDLENSGETALNKLTIEGFDIVITDLRMPGMSGIDLVREMKADDTLRHISVLVLTAENEKEKVLELVKAGVSGYIIKPYTQEALHEKILGLATYLL